MRKRKKKILASTLLALLALCTYLILSGTTNVRDQAALSNSDFIRLHVIANSNSAEDQALKLQVRDKILENLEAELTAETFALAQGNETGQVALEKEEYERFLADSLGEIEALAGEVVQASGQSYPAEAELTVCWIPEKSYGEITFPAGNYEALRVVLGEGVGENWWCVLFPPLCLIGTGSANSAATDPDQEFAAMQAALSESTKGKYDVLFTETNQPVELKLKFKTLELFAGE